MDKYSKLSGINMHVDNKQSESKWKKPKRRNNYCTNKQATLENVNVKNWGWN